MARQPSQRRPPGRRRLLRRRSSCCAIPSCGDARWSCPAPARGRWSRPPATRPAATGSARRCPPRAPGDCAPRPSSCRPTSPSTARPRRGSWRSSASTSSASRSSVSTRPTSTSRACSRRARRCAAWWPRSRPPPGSRARWASARTSSWRRSPPTPRSRPGSWPSTREQACARFAGSPPGLVPGIGPKTSARLNALGLKTLAAAGPGARGSLDRSASGRDWDASSSAGRASNPTASWARRRKVALGVPGADLRPATSPLPRSSQRPSRGWPSELCESLRRHGRRGRTISIKVRLDDFTTVTRSHTVASRPPTTRDRRHGRGPAPARGVRAAAAGAAAGGTGRGLRRRSRQPARVADGALGPGSASAAGARRGGPARPARWPTPT